MNVAKPMECASGKPNSEAKPEQAAAAKPDDPSRMRPATRRGLRMLLPWIMRAETESVTFNRTIVCPRVDGGKETEFAKAIAFLRHHEIVTAEGKTFGRIYTMAAGAPQRLRELGVLTPDNEISE